MQFTRPARAALALALAGSFGLAACGSDDDAPAMSGDPTTSTSEADEVSPVATPEAIEVTGIDYAFEGIPSEVEAGTELSFVNGSDVEPHELILMRVVDGEERSVEELLALGDAAQEFVTMKGVSVAALPGSEGQVVEGELVADEPGRYVALCFLPVGSDPEAMQAAAESGEPPAEDPNAGPPHFVQGMVQEFQVK